ncbi:uncharacterized protein I303_108312 [Kwoniella dejecticola CBS 10117]|uniref:Uncharacterized protein n=1 Tax=Kwoniella dejecticola CBS 10117 TaxID=1296121 RepID=A0A1A5ZXR1_9TREE|nr:uncharacterized protein I303_07361 [Kwoniella dejecticola CBS 10117]OBR82599.1 hypothetical protein I303_07361 [Kwoniella dejecticola CBS 10117]
MHKPGDKYTDRGNKRAHRNPGESAPHNITSPENAKFADTVRSPKYPRYHGRQTPYSSRSTSDDPYRPESAPTSGRSSIVYSISSDSVRTGGEGHSDGSDSDDDSISNSRMRKLSPYISGSNSLSSEPSSTYDSSSDSDLDSSGESGLFYTVPWRRSF